MMWADHAISELRAGRTVQVRPSGHSMQPRVPHRSLVTLEPVSEPADLIKGAVVLVRVRGRVYLHLISAVQAGRLQISNNRGHVNGWVSPSAVYGIATAVHPPAAC
jgi:hypothetical protein